MHSFAGLELDPLTGMPLVTKSPRLSTKVFSPPVKPTHLARATDDVNFFLETVDVASVPRYRFSTELVLMASTDG